MYGKRYSRERGMIEKSEGEKKMEIFLLFLKVLPVLFAYSVAPVALYLAHLLQGCSVSHFVHLPLFASLKGLQRCYN